MLASSGAFAADSGRFPVIEASINVADQWNLRHVLGRWPELGVIAKRPLANAPCRFASRPFGHHAEVYWERLDKLALDRGGLEWAEFALRFTAYAPGVHTAIVGTAKLANLRRNVELVGPRAATVSGASGDRSGLATRRRLLPSST